MLATAGHVDHGKSTLVRALTGRDPDRLAEEKARGLTIELGFAWTRLPGGADVAFVDVPGHQRFVGTMLAGLGPAPAVVFVVAADQGWQAQSSEHLAAVQALGITDGVLVITRCDLAEPGRPAEVLADAAERLAGAGLEAPAVGVSATTGEGMAALRSALDELVTRTPSPDPGAPVRLWCDRSFTVAGAGTVVTGTLGAGILRTGDHLTLLSGGQAGGVVVRALHSQDVAHDAVGPVSRVAVNLRRLPSPSPGRGAVLLTPGAFAVAEVVDTTIEPVGHTTAAPAQAMLHVGSADHPVHVRPLGSRHARLSLRSPLPWHAGDRAIVRDPGTHRLWSVQVVDVDPLPLRRRGAALRRAGDLEGGHLEGGHVEGGHVEGGHLVGGHLVGGHLEGGHLEGGHLEGGHLEGGHLPAKVTPAAVALSDVRLRSRGAEHATTFARLGLPTPTVGTRLEGWWVDDEVLAAWTAQVGERVRAHHRDHPLSQGMTLAEVAHLIDLPHHLRHHLRDHLRRPVAGGGGLPADVPALVPALVRRLVDEAGLAVTEGRVLPPDTGGLGPAERAVATLEARLRKAPFDAPERDELRELGLGPVELAAAVRLGRLVRVSEDIVLLPDAPARAMRELASLDQPFTLGEARQALGTTRRVAVPLLEHLDARGWTRRIDSQLRSVVR
ncbi:selenocysteine-specific translation elongation factor [Ornithinimicrobium tianjinense]|uniref:Selenocysteine-specific translation elongation factor n=1 Tax=Ornithinimicrobium tianjinense TaxID=1195761 RepID=A0A917FAA0_9MICO|nr:selenocysteine-specific translation elongation factor [Ornithinimicrobium tianjinense]